MQFRFGADAFRRAAVVLVSVSLSWMVTFALKPLLEGQAHLLPFTLAVMASAWYGGLFSGLAATAVSFLIADYFFIEPVRQINLGMPGDLVLLLLLAAVAVAISLLQGRLAKSAAALEDSLRRVELAAQEANIGFHEFIAAEQKQIWTPQMERLFGLAPGSFEGTDDAWIRRIHPDDRERVANSRQQCIEQRLSDWKYDYRAILPDGRTRWIEGRSHLLFSRRGALERIVGVNIDVTDRKELEQGLVERSKELAQSNEELERFAYAVSHDLQEPLRTISMMAELFRRRNASSLDAESNHLLDTILSSTARMKQLIQDVLELARAGNQSAAAEILVESQAIAELAVENLRVAASQKAAHIVIDRLPPVCANREQLLRVFQNLIGNAIKYHSDKPPEIRISASSQGDDWVFSVRDNGIGVDPKYHKKIFESFQRLHSRSEYEGSGLGLATCKRIVQRHRGRIWVESQPGQGSTFYFTLPKNREFPQPVYSLPRKPADKTQASGGCNRAVAG